MSMSASQKVTCDAAIYNGELPGRDNTYLLRTGIVSAARIWVERQGVNLDVEFTKFCEMGNKDGVHLC